MLAIKKILFAMLLGLIPMLGFAGQCCEKMGGLRYCDTSAGRCVCNNGYYTACYCTRHAVMDLQLIQGCCQWQGGVASTDNGVVLCRDGSVSELCTRQIPQESFATW